MTEAIFGLIGVVLGGLLTVAVERFKVVQARRQRGQVAARLVVEELLNASFALRMATEACDDAQVAMLARGALELELVSDKAWSEYRADLADALDDAGWMEVSDAYFALRSVSLYAAGDHDDALASEVRDSVSSEALVKAGQRLSRISTPSLVGRAEEPAA